MFLSCPYCGARNETEFDCGGESHIARPPLECLDEVWADYLFYRHNPKGLTYERWRHSAGCGQWFNVSRCTVTHQIFAVYAMTDAKPDLPLPEASGEPLLERAP